MTFGVFTNLDYLGEYLIMKKYSGTEIIGMEWTAPCAR